MIFYNLNCIYKSNGKSDIIEQMHVIKTNVMYVSMTNSVHISANNMPTSISQYHHYSFPETLIWGSIIDRLTRHANTEHVWAIGNAINTLIGTRTHKNKWWCYIYWETATHLNVLKPRCVMTHNNTSVNWQVTLKINRHGNTYWNVHNEPQCSFKRNKWTVTINKLAPTHASTDAPWTRGLNCRTGRSYLCKHKDLLCTLKRNNCTLLIPWRV